jgi:hypothetical protein
MTTTQRTRAYRNRAVAAQKELRELNAELLAAIEWIEEWFEMNIDGGGNHACPYCYLSNECESWDSIKHSGDCLIGKALAKAEALK